MGRKARNRVRGPNLRRPGVDKRGMRFESQASIQNWRITMVRIALVTKAFARHAFDQWWKVHRLARWSTG